MNANEELISRLRQYASDGDVEGFCTIADLLREAAAALSAQDDLLATLKDPTNVHVMMLRGIIARPSWRNMVDLLGEVPNREDVQLSRIAQLQEELEAAKSAPDLGALRELARRTAYNAKDMRRIYDTGVNRSDRVLGEMLAYEAFDAQLTSVLANLPAAQPARAVSKEEVERAQDAYENYCDYAVLTERDAMRAALEKYEAGRSKP